MRVRDSVRRVVGMGGARGEFVQDVVLNGASRLVILITAGLCLGACAQPGEG